jgi:hypothetical protein
MRAATDAGRGTGRSLEMKTNSQPARRKARASTPPPDLAPEAVAAAPAVTPILDPDPEGPPAIEGRPASAVHELERALGVKLPAGSALAGLVETLVASDAVPLQRRFRLDEGGAVALELVRIARRPEVLARLQDLECQSWSCASIAALERLGDAAVELYTLARHARRHIVSPALLAEAVARRDRLLALLRYHFAKDEEMMAKAAKIDPGKTQSGLASALIELHALLVPHQAFLSHDRTSYDATDFEEAPKLAQRIMRRQAASVAATLTAVRRGLRGELVRAFDDVRLAIGFVSFRWSKPPVLPTLGDLTAERRKRQGGPSEEDKAKRAARKAARAAEAEAKKTAAAAKRAEAKRAKAAAGGSEAPTPGPAPVDPGAAGAAAVPAVPGAGAGAAPPMPGPGVASSAPTSVASSAPTSVASSEGGTDVEVSEPAAANG